MGQHRPSWEICRRNKPQRRAPIEFEPPDFHNSVHQSRRRFEHCEKQAVPTILRAEGSSANQSAETCGARDDMKPGIRRKSDKGRNPGKRAAFNQSSAKISRSRKKGKEMTISLGGT